MDREENYEMVIREMTETAVRERNEHSPEAKDCVVLLKKLGVL